MDIIVGKASTLLRNKYIDSFIECSLPHYVEMIAKTKNYVDGECYIGYLWDCQRNSKMISESKALEVIRTKQSKIYVMWDIHSCENIFIKNYWKYPKDAILCLEAKEFLEFKDTFPEDIYVFDLTFTWTVTFTHEYSDNIRECRYALRG